MTVQRPQAASPRRWPLGERALQVNAALRYEDLSWRARFGCKGPQAESWLASLGHAVPSAANSARMDAQGVLVARLARTEFLIEAVEDRSDSIASTARRLQQAAPASGAYPVARQDVVIGIEGAGTNVLLRQICSVDFAALLEQGRADGWPLVLTSMVGVSVVAWPRPGAQGPGLTLWLDPSFGDYFCATLLQVGSDIGGAFSAAALESNIVRRA